MLAEQTLQMMLHFVSLFMCPLPERTKLDVTKFQLFHPQSDNTRCYRLWLCAISPAASLYIFHYNAVILIIHLSYHDTAAGNPGAAQYSFKPQSTDP